MHKRKGFTPLVLGTPPQGVPKRTFGEIEIPNGESGSFVTVPVSPRDSAVRRPRRKASPSGQADFRRKKFSDEAGFTLIELLVVIAIIALLVAKKQYNNRAFDNK